MTEISAKTRKVGLLILLVLAALGIINLVDFAEVQRMTGETKTVCVGRVLIDVPNEAQISYRSALVSGWFIDSAQETAEDFAKKLSAHESKLKSELNERGKPSLELIREIKAGIMHGKIFVFNRQWTDWFEGEKQIFADFAAALAYVHTGGTTFLVKSEMGGNHLSELNRLISRLTPRTPEKIPDEPGLCLPQGFLADPALPKQTESVIAFFHFEKHPDFGVALRSSGGLKPSPPLFERVANVSSEIAALRKVLRRENRTINGFVGQEFIEKFREFNGASTHNLTWESISDPNNLLKPELNFELSTGISARPGGKPEDASLSDLALLQLWDSMLNSIRLRPVALNIGGK